MLNNLTLQDEPEPEIFMAEKRETGDKAHILVQRRKI